MLGEAFAKLGTIDRHADWCREVEAFVVPGPTYWEIFRTVQWPTTPAELKGSRLWTEE